MAPSPKTANVIGMTIVISVGPNALVLGMLRSKTGHRSQHQD
jgi:hypothetical protein